MPGLAPRRLNTSSAPPALVLEGGNLFDGTEVSPRPHGRIVINGDTIACVGTAATCPVPDGATVMTISDDAWVMPGLVDAHVHFGQTGWFDGRPSSVDLQDEFPYPEIMARGKNEPQRYFRSYLCSGVTAVFDTGGYPWSLDLSTVSEHDPFAPHVTAAGPRITHAPPAAMNLPAEQQYVFLSSEAAGRAAVRANAAFGADAIKIWFLRVEPNEQELVDARVLAVADEAATIGLPLIVHATTLREAKVALRAGTHLLVHGVDDEPIDEEFLALLQRHDTIYTPTLRVSGGYLRMFEALMGVAAPELNDPNRCIDSETHQRITASSRLADHPSVRALELDLDAYRKRLEESYARKVENLLRVHRAGIPIAVGTDAGNPGSFHGPAIYSELEAMQAAGIAPEKLLVMATASGALAMGRDDIGTLTEGNVADMIILSDSPLEDVTNLRHITHVVRAGVVHRVEELAGR